MTGRLLAPLTLSLALAACASAPPPAGGGHHEGHGDAAAAGHHAGHHDKRFEDAEAWAERFDDPARDAWQRPEEVIALMAVPPGATVADIGAGTGYFLPHLSAAVGAQGRVLGLDLEASMVEYMTARAEREGLANVEARQVAADDPGLEAGSVERILIVDTWHHIPERGAYAARLADALAPGGTVTVVDFTLETHRGPPVEHRLAPEAIAAELEAGGLEATVVTDETLPDQVVVVGRKP